MSRPASASQGATSSASSDALDVLSVMEPPASAVAEPCRCTARSPVSSRASRRRASTTFHGLPSVGPKLGAVSRPRLDRVRLTDRRARGRARRPRRLHATPGHQGRRSGVHGRRRAPRPGIGPRLLERLAERAAEAGIERFVADVLAENRPMLKVFESGFRGLAKAGRLRARGQLPDRADRHVSRPHRSTGPPRGRRLASTLLRPIECCRPRRSRRRDSIGGRLFRNIVEAEFTGVVYPVNRGAKRSPGSADTAP